MPTGSVPVYAVGDQHVIKLHPPGAQDRIADKVGGLLAALHASLAETWFGTA